MDDLMILANVAETESAVSARDCQCCSTISNFLNNSSSKFLSMSATRLANYLLYLYKMNNQGVRFIKDEDKIHTLRKNIEKNDNVIKLISAENEKLHKDIQKFELECHELQYKNTELKKLVRYNSMVEQELKNQHLISENKKLNECNFELNKKYDAMALENEILKQKLSQANPTDQLYWGATVIHTQSQRKRTRKVSFEQNQ